MWGKLALAVGTTWAGLKVVQWWRRHKEQFAVTGGHSYTVVLDYTGTPLVPPTQAEMQSVVDANAPGALDVVAFSPVPNAKQLAVTLVATATGYITGDELTKGWDVNFGAVTLSAPPIDMGAAGAGTAAAPITAAG